MKYILIGAIVLVLGISLLAGCIQTQKTPTTGGTNTGNIPGAHENVQPNQTQIESENITNASEINDTSEMGYLDENISVF